jgi:serine/threonine protein kinase
MDKSDIKAQEMTMNVRREIAIMKALKHRNIVNLRCVLTSNSKLYIVMDMVTGGELFTKNLNEGKVEESVARRYFQQLVDGVEYCHRRGVCHRDLKPENLLIDSDNGELKITDFGLSAMSGADTTEALLHTQCGSPSYYCAPEIVAHKQGYNGAKVDAWSCGIILFALLAGFLPFYDENTNVLYRMIQKDDVKFPRRFPLSAKDLVQRLLHKEPEKRINLVDVKKHPWFVLDYAGDDLDVK